MFQSKNLLLKLSTVFFLFSLRCHLFLQISIAIDAVPLGRALTVSLLLQFILLLNLDCSLFFFPFFSLTVVFGGFSSSTLQFSLKADLSIYHRSCLLFPGMPLMGGYLPVTKFFSDVKSDVPL